MENGNADDDDDDDVDLFGSDEDDEETARIKQERLDAYAAKKSKKPAIIAKSSILLDVKPVNKLPLPLYPASLLTGSEWFQVTRLCLCSGMTRPIW